MAKKRIKKNWLGELKKLHKDDSIKYTKKGKSPFFLPVTIGEHAAKKKAERKKHIRALEKEDKKNVIGKTETTIKKYTSKRIGFSSEESYQKLKALARFWKMNIPETVDRLITDAVVRMEATELFEIQLKKGKEDNDK